MLAANAVQELHVGVRPVTSGSKFFYLNVVDIEYHQLVSTKTAIFLGLFYLKSYVLPQLC